MASSHVDPTGRERLLDEVIGGYLEAVASGRGPDRQELIAGHSELAGELAAFFADYDRLQRLAGPLRPVAEAARAADPATEPAETAAPGGQTTDAGAAPTFAAGAPAADLTAEPADGEPADGDEPELPRGTQVRYFGDYELRRVLGRGGMGVVYKAQQLSLNRPVALKMIRAGLWAGDDEVRRFKNEAEAVANLDHPRIVTIHEVGQHDGRHYFSMRLVEGPGLDRRLEELAAEPREAAHLVAEVARAVHHAHQRGILHRDLKPSNILLDGEGRPHVTDFGLAKRIEGDGSLSVSGSIVGTPSYMSPEQAAGSRRGVTTATDVYGLGALLYAALTASPPFQADSVVETLQQVQERQPESPSKVNGKVRRDLEVICLKCLEKDPKRRYGSAEAVAEDLERFLRGEPILARRTSIPERALKWARRRPAIAALVAVVHVVALLGLAGIVWQWRAAVRARDAEALANRSLDGANRSLEATNKRLEANLYANTIGLAASELQGKNLGRAMELLESCPERLRGWEWRYLRGLRFREPLILRGHPGEIHDLAFSPDGRRLASAGLEGAARIWDATTGEELFTIRSRGGPMTSVAFHPDGRRLLVVNENPSTIRLWDTTTDQELRTFRGLVGNPTGVRFSPDGRRVIAASWDATVRIWDTDTGRLLRTLGQERRGPAPNSEGIMGALWVAVHPDGRHVAANYNPVNRVKVWDLETGEVLWTTPGAWGFNQLSYSSDGRFLAVTQPGVFSSTSVLDATRGRVVTSVTGVAPKFLGDSRRVFTASGDSVKVWDTADGQLLVSLRTPGEVYRPYSGTSPDGRRLAAVTIDGEIRLWDAPPAGEETGEDTRVLGSTEIFGPVAFRPAGRQMAAVSADGTARVWDTASWRELMVLRGHDGPVWDVTYSPDSRLLATTGSDRTVRLWDAETGRLLRSLSTPDEAVDRVVFSPDGGHLIGKAVHWIKFWDLAGERWLDSPEPSWMGAWMDAGMAQDPGGRYLIMMPRKGGLRVCDAKTGQLIRDVQSGAQGDSCVAFHPDGRLLASAGVDRSITLWETTGWTRTRTLRGHDSYINRVASHPDGQRMASGGNDGTVVLWDLAAGRIVRTLKGNIGPVTGLSFSPDSRWLASASGIRDRGEILLWDLTRLDLLAQAREQAARDHAEGRRLARRQLWDMALAAHQKALEARQELARSHPDDPRLVRDLAESYLDWGVALKDAGRLHEAGHFFEKALEIRVDLARHHPGEARLRGDVADIHQALANLRAAAERWTEALASCRRAAEAREQLAREHPDDPQWRRDLVVDTYWMLIACQRHGGLLSEAEQSLRRVLELLDRLLRYDPQDLDRRADAGHAWLLLAELRWTLGRRDEALGCYERARGRWEAVVRQADNPWCRSTLAWCHALVGRGQVDASHGDEAARSLRRALGLIDQVGEPDRFGLLRSAPALAQVGAVIESDRLPLSAAERARCGTLANQAIERLRRALAEWSPEREHEVNYQVLQGDNALRFSPSFDALRPRADFRLLLLDADFPSWPFTDDSSITTP
jgi:WD40 repeat protein/tetratricopeptide (TPR) repeat protein